MSASDRCARITAAAMAEILEECADRPGRIEELADGAFAFIPHGVPEEQFGFSLDSPATPEEQEEAIRSCMNSEWARDWAESVLGPEAPPEALEQARRRACEGLFS